MFNLANEKLVEEGFKNLGLQIQQIVTIERDDIKSLTLNFIALRDRVEAQEKLNESLVGSINQLTEFVSKFKKELAEFKLNIKESLIHKPLGEDERIRNTKMELTIPEEPKKKEVDYDDERNWGYCMTCESKQQMKDIRLEQTIDSGKMTVGLCINCGRKLFRIH